ncbi:hypothetical protein L1285_19505 [Pseudoalteromonas sp. DL2-H2.2]|uniref:Uncharacterized protein n=1 Tax=Pseudoalteromonas rubra TaxID=43658 RepID=A0A0F4QFN6_9GAMM|nr:MULTISPECIES: hypothetical protein [Pseudoalteromonas]KJZ06538.1 hypothetical protein TW77_18740 [Pseudoalteromonas rubra]MCF2910501.1 hypothetical protein [Pseudoalteromonas sp. DL2-H2.2]
MKLKSALLLGALWMLPFKSLAAMDLAQYKHQALYGDKSRCMGARPPILISEPIDYALHVGAITERAAIWGKANGYYPVLSRFNNQVMLICQLS